MTEGKHPAEGVEDYDLTGPLLRFISAGDDKETRQFLELVCPDSVPDQDQFKHSIPNSLAWYDHFHEGQELNLSSKKMINLQCRKDWSTPHG